MYVMKLHKAQERLQKVGINWDYQQNILLLTVWQKKDDGPIGKKRTRKERRQPVKYISRILRQSRDNTTRQ